MSIREQAEQSNATQVVPIEASLWEGELFIRLMDWEEIRQSIAWEKEFEEREKVAARCIAISSCDAEGNLEFDIGLNEDIELLEKVLPMKLLQLYQVILDKNKLSEKGKGEAKNE